MVNRSIFIHFQLIYIIRNTHKVPSFIPNAFSDLAIKFEKLPYIPATAFTGRFYWQLACNETVCSWKFKDSTLRCAHKHIDLVCMLVLQCRLTLLLLWSLVAVAFIVAAGGGIASMWPIKCSHEKMFLLSIPFSFVHCRQFSVPLNHTKINMKNYSDFYSWIFYHCFGVAFILSHSFTFLFERSRRIELQIYTLKQWQCFCDYLLVRNMN